MGDFAFFFQTYLTFWRREGQVFLLSLLFYKAIYVN